MIKLEEPETPAFLKIGFFGNTKSGKTFTAAKVLSQFIRDYCPEKQLSMFDTEPSAGYIKDMVKQITGKPLLAIHSRSFSDLVEYANLCKEKGYVAWCDSITHPWRSLVTDYLEAKKSRAQGAGADPGKVRLSLKDWGPLKDMWAVFSSKYAWDPVHWCINGREGDVWDEEKDELGNEKLVKSGVKMKTETETGYEPSLLVQMRLTETTRHQAFVVGDRFNILTGKLSGDNPDIEFFRPHIEMLDLTGKGVQENKAEPVFKNAIGPNYETIKSQRTAILESIKDDILLLYPGMTANDKKVRIILLRKAFGTSSWTALEEDFRQFPIEKLEAGRTIIQDTKEESKCQET